MGENFLTIFVYTNLRFVFVGFRITCRHLTERYFYWIWCKICALPRAIFDKVQQGGMPTRMPQHSYLLWISIWWCWWWWQSFFPVQWQLERSEREWKNMRKEWSELLDVTARRCWVNLFDSIIVRIRNHDYSHFRVFTLLMFANSSYNNAHTHTVGAQAHIHFPCGEQSQRWTLSSPDRRTRCNRSSGIFTINRCRCVGGALPFSNLREDAISSASCRRCYGAIYKKVFVYELESV